MSAHCITVASELAALRDAEATRGDAAVARLGQPDSATTNPYVKAFLDRSPWQPRLVGVFGGELDYLDEGTLAQALRARRPVG